MLQAELKAIRWRLESIFGGWLSFGNSLAMIIADKENALPFRPLDGDKFSTIKSQKLRERQGALQTSKLYCPTEYPVALNLNGFNLICSSQPKSVRNPIESQSKANRKTDKGCPPGTPLTS